MTGERKTVLVVDDDVDLAEMIELLLHEAGYRVITAEEGREALRRITEEMPHVILLDMKMPGMNGWEFAREFHNRHDHLAPIVVLTAAEDARKRAGEIEAEGYLGKPFEVDDLRHIVAHNSLR